MYEMKRKSLTSTKDHWVAFAYPSQSSLLGWILFFGGGGGEEVSPTKLSLACVRACGGHTSAAGARGARTAPLARRFSPGGVGGFSSTSSARGVSPRASKNERRQQKVGDQVGPFSVHKSLCELPAAMNHALYGVHVSLQAFRASALTNHTTPSSTKSTRPSDHRHTA